MSTTKDINDINYDIINNSDYAPHEFKVNNVLKAEDMVEIDEQIHKNLTYIQYLNAHLSESKQDKLISSENIKTINGEDIVGEGNIDLTEFVVENIHKDLDKTYGITPDGIETSDDFKIKMSTETGATRFEVDHNKKLDVSDIKKFNDLSFTNIFSYSKKDAGSYINPSTFFDIDNHTKELTSFTLKKDENTTEYEIKNIKLSVGLVAGIGSISGTGGATGEMIYDSYENVPVHHNLNTSWIFEDTNDIKIQVLKQPGNGDYEDITNNVCYKLNTKWDCTCSAGTSLFGPDQNEFVGMTGQGLRYLITPKEKDSYIKIVTDHLNENDENYIINVILPKIIVLENSDFITLTGGDYNFVVHFKCDINEKHLDFTYVLDNTAIIKKGSSTIAISDDGTEIISSISDKNLNITDKHDTIKKTFNGIKISSDGVLISNEDHDYKKIDDHIDDLVSNKIDEYTEQNKLIGDSNINTFLSDFFPKNLENELENKYGIVHHGSTERSGDISINLTSDNNTAKINADGIKIDNNNDKFTIFDVNTNGANYIGEMINSGELYNNVYEQKIISKSTSPSKDYWLKFINTETGSTTTNNDLKYTINKYGGSSSVKSIFKCKLSSTSLNYIDLTVSEIAVGIQIIKDDYHNYGTQHLTNVDSMGRPLWKFIDKNNADDDLASNALKLYVQLLDVTNPNYKIATDITDYVFGGDNNKFEKYGISTLSDPFAEKATYDKNTQMFILRPSSSPGIIIDINKLKSDYNISDDRKYECEIGFICSNARLYTLTFGEDEIIPNHTAYDYDVRCKYTLDLQYNNFTNIDNDNIVIKKGGSTLLINDKGIEMRAAISNEMIDGFGPDAFPYDNPDKTSLISGVKNQFYGFKITGNGIYINPGYDDKRYMSLADWISNGCPSLETHFDSWT